LVRSATKIQQKIVREEGEKHIGLTKRTSVCLGKLEEVLTDLISLVIGDEEEDVAVSVPDAGSIASSGTLLAVGRSSWVRLLGSLMIMAMGRRRGGCGNARGVQNRRK
jgi:hypothetical protein